MRHAAENAPLFIEAFYDGCETLRANHPEYAIPDVNRMNRIFAENNVGYSIQPPNLISRNPQAPIAVPERIPSLTEQAMQLIQKSLSDSETLLVQGMNRQAVQEILWLLETVSTACQGLNAGSDTSRRLQEVAYVTAPTLTPKSPCMPMRRGSSATSFAVT
jgi:hypothetical protein